MGRARFAEGWYCFAQSTALRHGRPLVRQLLGCEASIARERDGAAAVTIAGETLRTREALGLVLAWFPGGAPAFELPWARLADPAWRYRAPATRTIEVAHERPFADYFDHWHTHHVHRIPYELRDIWFDGPRCGVSWDAELSPLHLDRLRKRGLPALRVTSNATLYGLGFAIDELTQSLVRFVNIQTNTPIDERSVEMTTLVGIRTPRLLAPVADAATALLARKIGKEIDHDVAYWRGCARRPVQRDDASTRDMARFQEWCDALA